MAKPTLGVTSKNSQGSVNAVDCRKIECSWFQEGISRLMKAPAHTPQLQFYLQCDILLATRMQKGTGQVSWSVASLAPGKWWLIRVGAAHFKSGFWAAVARWPSHAAAVSAGKDAKVTEMAWLASVQGAWVLFLENWGLGGFTKGRGNTKFLPDWAVVPLFLGVGAGWNF